MRIEREELIVALQKSGSVRQRLWPSQRVFFGIYCRYTQVAYLQRIRILELTKPTILGYKDYRQGAPDGMRYGTSGVLSEVPCILTVSSIVDLTQKTRKDPALRHPCEVFGQSSDDSLIHQQVGSHSRERSPSIEVY